MPASGSDFLKTAPKRTRGEGAQKIHAALREEILSMELPPGHPLDEAGLAAKFGVSRSPVREALVRLSADGLVNTLPNKSTIVSPLNVEDFPRYMDALDLLQRAVTRLAAILRTDTDLESIRKRQAEFREAVDRSDAIAMIERNCELHMAIARAGRNRYLTDSYRRLLDEGRRTLRLYFRSFNDKLPPELAEAHDRIIEALEQQDADLAERLAHEHALELQNRFVQYMSARMTSEIALRPAF
jgi:DNA-binding GntR family transcriptional regulator